MAVAHALGARRIIAIDISKARLEFAKTYLATDIFSPSERKSEGEESQIDYARRCAENLRAQLGISERGPTAVDVVIEASGAPICVQTGIFLVKPAGTFVQVGMGIREVSIPMTVALVKEILIKPSFRYGPGDYELAISLVAQGKINLKPLVTHRFKFEDARAAFEATKAGKGADAKGLIKAIINGPE